MKKHKHWIVLAGIALFTGILPPLTQQAHAQTSVSFQVFYDQLSPFGTWVNYPDYGYVWVPGAGSGFRPYGTRGHWVYTEDGWTWVSDYSWGWATFHYGNWFYDDSYGWMWTPGYEWAPAWVTWGESGGNYCWAPIGPRVDIGVSFSTYRPPARYWNFCPRERITSANVSNYYVRNMHNTTVINNITVINNVNRGNGHAYLRGPQADNVERFTHRTVRPVAIQAAARPGAASVQNGHLAIYRPAVQNNNASARPSQVRDLHALRPTNNHPQPASRPGQPASRPDQPVNHPGQPANHPAPPNNTPRQPVNTTPRQPVNHPGQPGNHPGQPAQRPMDQPMQRPNPPAQHPAQPAQQQQHPPAQQHPMNQPRPMQPQPRPAQPHPQPMQHPPMQQHPNPPQPRPVQPQQHPEPPHPEHH